MAEQFVKLPVSIMGAPDLAPLARIIYAALLDRADATGNVSAGLRWLAKVCGAHRNGVSRAVAELTERGYLKSEHDRSGCRTLYTVILEREKRHTECATSHKTKRHTECAGSHSESVTQSVPGCHTECAASVTQSVPRSERLLNQTKSGGAHHELVEHFCARWGERFGGKYPFDRTKDPTAAKRILESVGGDLERGRAVVSAYIATADRWLVERGCRLSLLASASQLPKFLATTARPTESEPESGSTEHPVFEQARARGWGDDVDGHPGEWAAVVGAVEDGALQVLCVKHSGAKSGAEFRQSLSGEIQHAKAEVG